MDKRNDAIYNQIKQSVNKINELNIEYDLITINENETLDNQSLFKILSEENKNLKSILTKLNKIHELKNVYEKLNSDTIININLDINSLDTYINTLNDNITKLNELKKQKETEAKLNVKSDDEDITDEPKINAETHCSMEEIKRAFFNNEFDTFNELIKQYPFCFYKADYKYASDNDGKPEFMAKNLVSGFVKGMEDYSKYFLTCFRCYKNNDKYEYPSFWIVNIKSNDIKEVIGSLYDDYDFIKVTESDLETFLLDLRKKTNDDSLLIEKYIH